MNQRQLRARLAQDLAADPDIAPAGEKGRPKKGEKVANSHLNALSSDSAERIVRRLKRDRPQIAAALARGEYPSARAAGIAAGFVKEPSTLDKIRRLWTKLTPQEQDVLLREFGKGKRCAA